MKKYIKLLFTIILNNIIIGMLLGFLWYSLGFAKTVSSMMISGIDSINIEFSKFQYIYYIIIFTIEFFSIVFQKKLFTDKKTCIIYYVISLILSIILAFFTSLRFSVEYNEPIQTKYIFLSSLHLRYTSWIFNFNIATLLGLIYIDFCKKEKV
mgnify:FL=1